MKNIGKYEICGLLGRGGMGTVYKVRIPVVGKILALKRLAPHASLVDLLGKQELRKRFVNEALTMARLRHPHVVAIWDFYDSDDLTFFAMEYYCNNLGIMIGETYRVEEPSRVVSVDKTFYYIRQILVGLSRLHAAHIAHRDIKPYNILVTEEGTAKITDFGLSNLRGETFHSPSNLMVGSPYYAAPEQEQDPNTVDTRADLYPVGIMFYRMLTGKLPTGDSALLSKCNLDLDRHWDTFVQKAMARDREKRFSSAEEMLASLDALQLAWDEKKEKVCQMPPPSTSNRKGQICRQSLRTAGMMVRPRYARRAFGTDRRWRPKHYLSNDFEVCKDGTVLDKTTLLVWHQSGSDYPMTWSEAHDYVEKLNTHRFAGRSNWRLPTIDELMSLLTRVPHAEDLCIETVFNLKEKWLWSADRATFVAAWFVSVEMGYVAWQDRSCYFYVRPVSSDVSPHHIGSGHGCEHKPTE